MPITTPQRTCLFYFLIFFFNSNEIVFPAAILQPPFYNSSYPAWSNFGGIGAIIGHEITHGFDDEGSLYNGDGKLDNWWTLSSRTSFESKADCVVNQYNGYEVIDDLNINGRLTLGENLADNGGLRISYLAWKNWIKNFPENFSEEEFSKYFPNMTMVGIL